ncbi:hypothetical protein BASA81_003798 [Batrachochytrium salamandrivorans]|nr:hypothetical protein BASA81_003798 [Batrachochytrium salamandrivorans]
MDALLERLIKEDEGEEEAESPLVELHRLVSQQGVLSLVEKLGQYLISDDTALRVRSTALLCECVCALEDSSAKLSTNQLETLLEFFLNRYKTDWESAMACLRGIRALLLRKSVDKTELFAQNKLKFGNIALAVLTDHDVTELVQTLRALVFEICLVLATDFRNVAFGGENWFGLGFQSAMEGERDPRCLLVCLRVLGAILVEAPPSWSVVEDAFELINVYFPITFQPPPNDPFGITHTDLVDALNQCFVANEQMVICALPMALERIKISSEETSMGALAKVESLRLVSLCCTKYNGEVVLAQHLQELRDSLVGLVMNPDEPELAGEALQVITLITRSLSARGRANPRDGLWDTFTLQILRVCGQSLEASMDSMSAQGASKVICAVGLASTFAFEMVMRGILPLLEKLLGENIPTKRLACLELIRNLCRCVDVSVSHPKGEGPLDPFAPKLFDLVGEFVDAMQDDTVQVSAFLTLKEIVCRPQRLLVDYDAQVLPTCQKIFKLCLDPISESASQIHRERIIVGMVSIRDMVQKSDKMGFLQECVDALLVELCTSTEATELILLLLPMLLVGQTEPGAIQTVVRFLLGAETPSDSALAKIAKTVSSEVLETLRFEELQSHPQVLAVFMERVSPEMNLRLVMECLPKVETEPYASTVLLAMRRDYAGVLLSVVGKIKQSPEVWANRDSLLNVFTCALNKAALGSEFDLALTELWAVEQVSELERTRLYARAFKALVWRSSPGPADKLGAYLHAQLHADSPAVALEACAAFGSVLRVDQGLEQPFSRVLGIAKQRTFTKWFKILYEDVLSSSSNTSEAVLMACASLAANTPIGVLKSSLDEVVVVMVRASGSSSVELQLCALQILKLLLAMVEEQGEFVASDHLHSLIPFLLAFTGREYTAQTRLDALHCLETLPQILKYHQLHPFRSVVSNTLARGALDDSRKKVRLQAVKCRERWVLFAAS